MSIKLTNQKYCMACGRKRHTSGLLYDLNTLKSYCRYEELCNDQHPKRLGKEIDLSLADSLDKALKERYGEELYREIERVSGRTTSFQITPVASMAILKYMQEEGLESKNKALNKIMDHFVMSRDDLDQVELQSVELASIRCNFLPKPDKTVERIAVQPQKEEILSKYAFLDDQPKEAEVVLEGTEDDEEDDQLWEI